MSDLIAVPSHHFPANARPLTSGACFRTDDRLWSGWAGWGPPAGVIE